MASYSDSEFSFCQVALKEEGRLPRRPNLCREFSMRWRQTLGNAFSKSKNREYRVDPLALALWMRASSSAKAMIADLPLLQPYWN